MALLTSQGKIRWKTPFGIEYTRRDFILQNKHQSFKVNTEETLAVQPTHHLIVNSFLERITIHQDVIQKHKSSYKNVSSFVAEYLKTRCRLLFKLNHGKTGGCGPRRKFLFRVRDTYLALHSRSTILYYLALSCS